jgi:uncharacterized protein (TIGR03663 family)
MSRGAFWVAIASALAAGLALRLADPGLRPMHHDEANQAVRFGILLEAGEYRYDRTDHHGPTLYYLTLPFAWMRGQHTLAALDERTIRMVPALFGAGTLLLFLFLSRGLGRTAVAAAAALAAISPVFTYYSRFYIQEPLFVFFVLAFLIALGFYAIAPRGRIAIVAGLAAGFAYATKETSIVVLPAAGVGCAIAAAVVREGRDLPRIAVRVRALHVAAALAAALLPAFVLYTGFFRNPSGLLDSFGAFSIYFARGVDAGPHVQPWSAYLKMLAWSSSGGLVWTEALILTLAAIGAVQAIASRRRSFWPFYICVYSLLTTAIFSAVPYKTPWNVLPFYVGIILLAGIGVTALLAHVRRPVLRGLVVLALVGAGWHLAMQNVQGNFRYPADPRNPYVYAHTSTDFLRLSTRVHDLAAVHPDRRSMLIKVIAGPYEQWPFPWYARDLTGVGYWSDPAQTSLDGAPVIIASQQHAAAVDAAVGDRYISEFYGLRPDVLLTLYVERSLWARFLETRQ